MYKRQYYYYDYYYYYYYYYYYLRCFAQPAAPISQLSASLISFWQFLQAYKQLLI